MRRLAAKETTFGALRAGKEASAVYASAWRQCQDPTKTVEDMQIAEAVAAEKAEREHIASIQANPKPRPNGGGATEVAGDVARRCPRI